MRTEVGRAVVGRFDGGTLTSDGGAVLLLMPNGHLESCVALQQLAVHAGVIWALSCAGISSDSVPETESSDCLSKLARLQEAVTGGVETS